MPVLAAALAVSLLGASPDGGTSEEVKGVMRGNFAALVALQPILASAKAFADPANAAALQSNLALLARVKHVRPAKDQPLPNAVAGVFGEAVDRARGELAAGQREQARLRLRGLTNLCYGCHARKPADRDTADLGRGGDAMALPPAERAQFFAATRQFDAALLLYADLLRAPPAGLGDPYSQALFARNAVLISVRVKDDPAFTLEVVRMALARRDLPTLVRRSLERWAKDTEAWKAEGFAAKEQTPAALFARAQQLIAASGAESEVWPGDEALVPLLRASGYLDEALAQKPSGSFRGEALYLLAVATAQLLDAELWDLDQLFLEACVRENPHSALARKCVARLGDRTVFLYSGSGGTRVPPEVVRRLEQLEALAR
jgi:hypothetical protein